MKNILIVCKNIQYVEICQWCGCSCVKYKIRVCKQFLLLQQTPLDPCSLHPLPHSTPPLTSHPPPQSGSVRNVLCFGPQFADEEVGNHRKVYQIQLGFEGCNCTIKTNRTISYSVLQLMEAFNMFLFFSILISLSAYKTQVEKPCTTKGKAAYWHFFK